MVLLNPRMLPGLAKILAEADPRLNGATSKDERQYGSPAILAPRLLLTMIANSNPQR